MLIPDNSKGIMPEGRSRRDALTKKFAAVRRPKSACVACILAVFILFSGPETGAGTQKPAGVSDVLIISGTVTDPHGKGVAEAALTFYLNDEKIELKKEILSSPEGTYEAELRLPPGRLASARLSLEISKPSYQSSLRLPVAEIVKEKTDDKGNSYFLAHKRLILERKVTPAFWIAAGVLLGVYVLIAFEIMHRTLAAFLGAALVLCVSYTAGTFSPGYRILSFDDAVKAIDLNVIFLLMAMMIMVSVIEKTGVFQWLAFRSYRTARGNVFVLATILMLITAVISSFLDNVTTMLLIIPVTMKIARALRVNPVTLMMPEVFASNIGGTATLIGDPPNIMIGSYAGLTFVQFLQKLSIVCLICLAVSIVYFLYWYKKDFLKPQSEAAEEKTGRVAAEEYEIKDRRLMVYCALVLGMTILLFIAHGALHMPPSVAAMAGTAVLLAISRVDIAEVLEHEVEWPTLIFFMMLFIVVAGAEQTGLIQMVADGVFHVSKGSLTAAVLVTLWVSALASSIIDNIPFTATMLPIVAYLTEVLPGAQGGILWWALALGACLGGNGTLIGASANVVTVGIAEREGYPVSFRQYFRIAFVPMIITIILCSVWLLAIEM